MDKYKDAVPMASRWKSLIDDAAQNPTANAEILSRAWTWYAWVVSDTPQADQMLSAARKAEQIAHDAGLTEHPFYYETLAVLAAVETATGDFTSARAHVIQAQAKAVRQFGPESSEAAFVEGTFGYIDLADGHYVDAERHYANAEQLSLRCSFPEDGFTGTMIDTHAVTLDAASRYEDSLVEHERAVTWAMAHSTEDSPTRTNAMAGLAAGLQRANRLGEAAEIQREVIDRQRRYEPENYWYRASQLSNYAETLNRMGRSDDAEEIWARAREFYGRSKTRQDPWLAVQPLYLPAGVARTQGHFAEAVTRYEATVAQLAADLPADNVRLAGVRIELGLSLASRQTGCDVSDFGTNASELVTKMSIA